MKKSNKNVSAMLAKLATGSGGISQHQAEMNDGYEKLATMFANCFLAGWALHISEDPEDLELAQELVQEVMYVLGDQVELVTEALLKHKGEPVGDILRAITKP